MKFNKSPESQQDNYFSKKGEEEQISKLQELQDCPEDPNRKLFKEKVKEQRIKEKNIPGSNIEIGFKREKLCLKALQELKKEEKIIDILPTGMIDVKGKFNENPTNLDLHEQTDFLITVASKGRIRFVKISVKPPESKTLEKKADIFLNIGLDDTIEEIKEQIEKKLANI
ncbi:MAG TPA: hypothetical protein P5225_02045 [Candidatus Paceibacterota bacterium]|jgi:hypothetical protein|nr:hypothetical protein [Candidatus Paceibacterota bacterium]